MEFVLHGLAEYSLISRNKLERSLEFKDILTGMFNMDDFGMDDFEE